MGQPAVVMGDAIRGTCAVHQIPSPSGAPMPAGPLPFSSPLMQALATTVTIGGKPAAVVGSSGLNQPPHVGLHASDPYLAPPTQRGQVVVGSATVFFDGQPAAYTGCQVTICAQVPGTLTGTATTVMVGP
jgi:uncharacterized Zn-binding protein involved in type VI secretion